MSAARSTTGICGSIGSSLTSVPMDGNSALNAIELQINQQAYTISVWTDNDATVGNHTVTVIAKLFSYTATSSRDFIITIEPRFEVFAGVKTGPYFCPSLKSVSMQQCPD